MPTSEQIAFTAEMDALLQKGLGVFGLDPGCHLGDWAVVLSAPFLNEDGDVTSDYAVTFSANLLEHNATGLLIKGKEILDGREDE
jgi:hypothetical protein